MITVITGHQGYIGTHLMKVLPDAIGLDIKSGQDILKCRLPKADVVIHLAAQADVIKSQKDPFETVRTNVLGTVRLAKAYKNTKFIFPSSSAAEEMLSPYGLSKYCAEEFIKMLFNNYVILRFANVYGEKGSRSVIDKFLKQKKLTIYGSGIQDRTFVHIDDIIKGIKLAVNWKKGVYSLGSDQNYTILSLAQMIIRLTKKHYQFLPERKGEIIHSKVENTTPNWHPKVNVIDYIDYIKNHENSCDWKKRR